MSNLSKGKIFPQKWASERDLWTENAKKHTRREKSVPKETVGSFFFLPSPF